MLDKKNFNKNLDSNNSDIIVILGAGSIGDYITDYLKIKHIK